MNETAARLTTKFWLPLRIMPLRDSSTGALFESSCPLTRSTVVPPGLSTLVMSNVSGPRFAASGVEGQNRDVALGRSRVIRDPLHGTVDDVEPEAATPSPDLGIAEIGRLPVIGTERNSMILNQEVPLPQIGGSQRPPTGGRPRAGGRNPPQRELPARVLLEPVLDDVGAGLVERGGEHLELGLGKLAVGGRA